MIPLSSFPRESRAFLLLHRLPIQGVKLDRSFVKEMESSERRATIVSAVVNLAKQLALERLVA